MVTDLMHDETALELGEVLGERNEGFIQMSYIPDASKYEGDIQDHTENHFEELALAAGRPILYNAMAVNDAHPERYRRQLQWIESCATRGIRVYGQSATLEVGFAFTFKDWNLWDDMPAWREVTTGPIEDRLMKLCDPERRPGLRKVEQTGLITNNVRRYLRARMQARRAEEVRKHDDRRDREGREQASGRCDARYRMRRRPQCGVLHAADQHERKNYLKRWSRRESHGDLRRLRRWRAYQVLLGWTLLDGSADQDGA